MYSTHTHTQKKVYQIHKQSQQSIWAKSLSLCEEVVHSLNKEGTHTPSCLRCSSRAHLCLAIWATHHSEATLPCCSEAHVLSEAPLNTLLKHCQMLPLHYCWAHIEQVPMSTQCKRAFLHAPLQEQLLSGQ
jgi:hypothetical protein